MRTYRSFCRPVLQDIERARNCSLHKSNNVVPLTACRISCLAALWTVKSSTRVLFIVWSADILLFSHPSFNPLAISIIWSLVIHRLFFLGQSMRCFQCFCTIYGNRCIWVWKWCYYLCPNCGQFWGYHSMYSKPTQMSRSPAATDTWSILSALGA